MHQNNDVPFEILSESLLQKQISFLWYPIASSRYNRRKITKLFFACRFLRDCNRPRVDFIFSVAPRRRKLTKLDIWGFWYLSKEIQFTRGDFFDRLEIMNLTSHKTWRSASDAELLRNGLWNSSAVSILAHSTSYGYKGFRGLSVWSPVEKCSLNQVRDSVFKQIHFAILDFIPILII